MNFQEVEYRLSGLSEQVRNGQITREQYSAAVNQLRVVDASGKTWQPNPGGPGWLFWDGAAWRQGNPPGQTPVPTVGEVSTPRSISEFRDQLIDYKTFRKISKEVPLAKRPQKWWDLFSILGGVVGAIIWIIYSKENLDFITPIIMIALPVILVWFRKDIDNLLLPLQPTRKKIPMMLLVGIGIALPFLTAFILYNIFHLSEYSLIRTNLIIGVLGAYILVRNPVLAQATHQIPGRGRPAFLLMVFCLLFIVAPVIADDCLRDPTRAEDCLRTPGFAEIIAGTAAAGLSILVNGPIIIQIVAAGAAGSGADGSGGKPGGSGKIYGTGTADDPYRDDGAIGKVGPDGTITPYPEAVNRPPKIFGTGNEGDPYTDIPPTSPPVQPPSSPPTPSVPPLPVSPVIPVPPIITPPTSPSVQPPSAPPTPPVPPLPPEPPVTPVPPTTPLPPVTSPPGPSEKPETGEGDGKKSDDAKTEGEDEKTVPEIIIDTADSTKKTIDNINEQVDKAKEVVDNNFSQETKDKFDKFQKGLKEYSDKLSKYAEKAKENAEWAKEHIDEIKGLKKNLEEIKKNVDEFNESTKNIQIDPRSRTIISVGIGTADALGRGFDKVITKTFGKKVADAIGAKDLGKNVKDTGEKIVDGATKSNQQFQDEATNWDDGGAGSDTIKDSMGGDYQKAKDQIGKQVDIDKIRKQQAQEQKTAEDKLKSYHPPPGKPTDPWHNWYPWNWKFL